ncbi:histidine phosphatase family protein [Paenisporosarcina quisquiliarum]|uniref:Histidine phosphatase family protein n=1 Tax=Paenisporosarcina quisquiliarum TaxID=365346 RepID=A0A9X3RD85_9BACL|nr:histidine phosphatase family protein [Paenisporosarcina quisquiliarum]MCZ8536819.1 histidine phosphatase family protein [Paenisporosarcina quisquiliarum]
MKTLYLVRHCSANGQAADAELTESGFEQAEKLAAFFSGILIENIISSPFKRAQDSIKPTAKAKNLPLTIDDRLAERTLSTSDLPNWLELLEETFHNLDLKLTGGETSREATSRAIEVINEAPNNTIIVTHGNLMSLILKHFDDSIGFQEWKSLRNPDVYTITIGNDESSFEQLWKD